MKKTWLISGCSGGLGLGIARAVLRRGDNAAVTSRNIERLQELTREYPGRVLPNYMDLNQHASLEQTAENTLKTFGSIDVLVNNAGHGYRAAVEESEPEAVRELFETNFFSPMELIRLVLPSMRKRRKGMIINVTSIGAVRGALGNGCYSAAKGALELASEALAREVRHLGIRVMLVEPGAFRTGFYGQSLGESSRKIEDYDSLAGQYRKEAMGKNHEQPGDPRKGGEILVETALREEPPFRLLLGSDAVRAAKAVIEARLREIQDWEAVSIQSDIQADSDG